MDYGNLSSAEQALFLTYQGRVLVQPTKSVWLSGYSDIDDRVLYINTYRALESDRGQGSIRIGSATVVLDNTDGKFYDDGVSKIADNAEVQIWLGYKGLNVPVFNGVSRRVTPRFDSGSVIVEFADKMILMYDQRIDGSQDPNNTPKLIVEDFCSQIGAASNIGSGTELTTVYDNPVFDYKTMLSALEEVQNSVFHVAYFDETGTMQIQEREYRNAVDWTYDERNVGRDIQAMAPTQVINEVWIEYDENFFVREIDQGSIDDYGKQMRTPRILILNSELVSSRLHGRYIEELDNSLEGFQITSAAGSSAIDNVHLMMAQDGAATGYMTVKIYTDSAGSPDTLLGTSQNRPSANLDVEFIWERFYFSTPVEIAASTDYWVIIDTSSVSAGTVYVLCSRADATGKHAYGSWTLEDNKRVLHIIKASKFGRRVAEDMVRFHKAPADRLLIPAKYGIPQLQFLDEVMVDVEAVTCSTVGKYVIEGIEHVFSPDSFITTHWLRKSSVDEAASGDSGGAEEGGTEVSAISAYANTQQAISGNTRTKVQLDTELFDTLSEFDSTTNYDFIPVAAGKYLISASATLDNVADGDQLIMEVYVNYVAEVTGREIWAYTEASGANAYTLAASKVLNLSAGDKVTMYVIDTISGCNIVGFKYSTYLTAIKLA